MHVDCISAGAFRVRAAMVSHDGDQKSNMWICSEYISPATACSVLYFFPCMFWTDAVVAWAATPKGRLCQEVRLAFDELERHRALLPRYNGNDSTTQPHAKLPTSSLEMSGFSFQQLAILPYRTPQHQSPHHDWSIDLIIHLLELHFPSTPTHHAWLSHQR